MIRNSDSYFGECSRLSVAFNWQFAQKFSFFVRYTHSRTQSSPVKSIVVVVLVDVVRLLYSFASRFHISSVHTKEKRKEHSLPPNDQNKTKQ